jgi:hypothetical protein
MKMLFRMTFKNERAREKRRFPVKAFPNNRGKDFVQKCEILVAFFQQFHFDSGL